MRRILLTCSVAVLLLWLLLRLLPGRALAGAGPGPALSPLALIPTGATAIALDLPTLYVGYDTRLTLIDLTDPAAPAVTAVYTAPGAIQDLHPAGGRLYLALGVDGVAALDVRDPLSPTLEAHLTLPAWTEITGVVTQDDLLYLLDQHGEEILLLDWTLRIHRLDDWPDLGPELGNVTDSGAPRPTALGVGDGLATFVSSIQGIKGRVLQLLLVDVGDPAAPVLADAIRFGNLDGPAARRPDGRIYLADVWPAECTGIIFADPCTEILRTAVPTAQGLLRSNPMHQAADPVLHRYIMAMAASGDLLVTVRPGAPPVVRLYDALLPAVPGRAASAPTGGTADWALTAAVQDELVVVGLGSRVQIFGVDWPGGEASFGPGGGQVTLANGVVYSAPAASLSGTVTLSHTERVAAPYQPQPGTALQSTGALFTLAVSPTTGLQGPVTVVLPVDATTWLVFDPATVQLHRQREGSWDPLPTAADPDGQVISATVDGPGIYALLGRPRAGVHLPLTGKVESME